MTNFDNSSPGALSVGSRAVIIAEKPLLEASVGTAVQRTLTIYGKPETTYEIQYAADLGASPMWVPIWTNTLPANMFTNFLIGGNYSTIPALFIRAVER